MNPLRVVDLHKAFHGKPVLSGIDFELQPGELYGAGKSTLLRILAGELPADRATSSTPARWATARRRSS